MKKFVSVPAFLAALAVTYNFSYAQGSGLLTSRGGDEITTITTTLAVATGNNLNLSFDNTELPNIPDAWGPTSAIVIIGKAPLAGTALRGRSRLDNRTGYITRLDLYVVSSAMADGAFVSVAAGKGISPFDFQDDRTPIAYYVRLKNISGELRLMISYPTNSGQVDRIWPGVVSLQTAYEIYIEYALVGTPHTICKINGETIAAVMHDASAVQSIGTLILGSSGASTGRNVIYLLDRIFEAPIPSGGF